MHLSPYSPVTECGSHLACRKPSVFLLPFSPEETKQMSAWALHMLPRELTTMQETPETQLLLQMCPLVWAGHTAQEVQFSLSGKELGTHCQEPAQEGANTQTQLTATGVILWYAAFLSYAAVLLLFQKENSQVLILLVYLGTELGRGTWTIVR